MSLVATTKSEMRAAEMPKRIAQIVHASMPLRVSFTAQTTSQKPVWVRSLLPTVVAEMMNVCELVWRITHPACCLTSTAPYVSRMTLMTA